eukprot:3281810-Alexandrium_andersonii.AAC.1
MERSQREVVPARMDCDGGRMPCHVCELFRQIFALRGFIFQPVLGEFGKQQPPVLHPAALD